MPTQSVFTSQPFVGPHFAHAPPPPQSLSVSFPFLTPSTHVAAWQSIPLHTPSTQSAATAHVSPVAHVDPQAPPQSMSVSEPFFTPSLQLAGTHTCIAHFGAGAMQSASRLHSTQFPAPSHT